MALPRGPRFPTFGGVAPPPTTKDRAILAVGWRVLVSCRNGGSEHVTLTDESGTSPVATVADGVEVEIVAWRPRRGGDTRYRVVSTNGGIEGWLGAASLQARHPSPSPKVAVVSAAPLRTGPERSERSRPPRTAAENVALKTTNHSAKSTRRGTR